MTPTSATAGTTPAHAGTGTPLDPPAAEEATYAQVTRRIIPFLCLCFVIAFLDRVNVSFAKLQMLQDLQFSETVYGLGAGIFFIAYFLFEVPSNLIMHRVGARRWIARIMITWALLTCAMAFVQSATAFYVVRFLLGAAEAGFFPGMILYLTYWYPVHRRSRITALFMTAIPIAGVLGGMGSGWILQSMNGVHGMAGWQWLFVLEGIPSLIVGICVLFYLDDGIAAARWLTPAQKALLQQRIDAESSTKAHVSVGSAFRHPLVWLLALVYFGSSMGQYGFGFWLPSIIKATGVSSPLHIGLLSAIPYAFGIVAMILVGRHSDRTGERRWHYGLSALVSAAGLVGAVVWSHDTAIAMVALTFASMGLQCLAPVFWTLPTGVLGGVAAAAGIAVINAIGNLAGFVSPYLVGWVKDTTGTTAAGMYVIAGFLLLAGALVVLCVRPEPRR
ncbi:major facilitator superfamily MFS_1 [Paracidovorax avenae ATCC 19860]|uniref:Putative tartrate transporter n=1 Tax=Paracidovorax avenae (strain ATCC 19860 / DSM 7227 / CCUG 15838 / JCM 20985 / LMG 2117 / NCPPB 1011) TaxID=643561 RepID=F0Q5V5_PARA1|nr:MFS transporter [Paracidovorax avenae]ADX46917.1 major facilitator superfamily MFS_1 [Paracidovorax avenae ATCC 19860]